MPPETLQLPADLEHLVVEYLRGSTDMQSKVAQRVGVELPSNPVFPRLLIQLLPGFIPVRHHLYRQTVTIQSYGNNRDDAWHTAEMAHGVIMRMHGVYTDAVVTDVEALVTPWWLPDDEVPAAVRARYVADYRITHHPNPT
jgi:hypothetical protein